MNHDIAQYLQNIHFIESLIRLGTDEIAEHYSTRKLTVSQCRMRYLLQKAGNPQKQYTIIHIAGTSGKGSTASMIQAILSASGIRCGLYTSPHPTTTLERIKVNDLYISPQTFNCVFERIKPLLDEAYFTSAYGKPKYLEIILLLALSCFAEEQCQWLVLETHMGGKFDITNVCESAIQVITNIGYDHRHLLGNTLQKIAAHKFGIVKKQSVVFSSEQRPALIRQLQRVCDRTQSKLEVITDTVTLHRLSPQGMDISFEENKERFRIPMFGVSQMKNAALSFSVAQYFGVHTNIVKQGFLRSKLPCRTELAQNDPFVILDAAHNKDKMRNLVSVFTLFPHGKKFLILSLGQSKEASSIMREIIPFVDEIFITRFDNNFKKCYSPKYLLRLAKQYKKKAASLSFGLDPHEMLAKSLSRAKKEDLIIITGSYYLAGELRKHWHKEEAILRRRNSF